MVFSKRRLIQLVAASSLFCSGIVVGSIATQRVSALNKFGQPKTVVHVVAYKFKDTTSQTISSRLSKASKTWPPRFRVSRISG